MSAVPDTSCFVPERLPDGLVYVTDEMPGIRRVRNGSGFSYRAPDGRPLTREADLARIRRLAIPPAYEDVWICPLSNGHLQATGRDARARKQYRYHELWRLQRDEHKFDRLAEFGERLPRIRNRIARELERGAARAPDRTTVLATVVRLLDTTLIRVGNDSYARENGSFGLTTLRNRHVIVGPGTLRLRFRGKSGVQHDVRIDDRRVAKIVRRCQQLPGQTLFTCVEADGECSAVGSADVNDYLADIAGERVTAKDFRTWHGSALALDLLWTARRCEPLPSPVALLRDVAGRLGNTVAVCRKAYVHPDVQQLGTRLRDESFAAWRALARLPARPRGLTAPERRLLKLLG